MSVISTIDCTLRDGGYTNNWAFSNDFRIECIKSLIHAGVEIIECGFISSKSGNDDNGTNFKSIEKVNEFLKENSFNNSASKFAVMMKLDEYPPEAMPECVKAENCVTIIRVMVYKNEIEQATEIIKKIIAKGYEVHIQPTIISYYSDEEIVNMLKKFKPLDYKAIAIVDTFGAINDTKIKNKTLLFDKYANKEAKLTLHCHNNLATAYLNVQAFMASVNSKRDIFIDASLGGLGRGAGNIATEIILAKLKTEKKANYSVIPVNSFCNEYITNFKRNVAEKDFYAYMITAQNNMHPNYATFLIMNGFSRKHICKILELIIPEKYETFDFEYIKSLCEIYMIKR